MSLSPTSFQRFGRLVAGLALVATACTQDPTAVPPSRDDAIASLIADGSSNDVAQCVIGLLSGSVEPAAVLDPSLRSGSDQLLIEEATVNCELASDLLADDVAPPSELAFDLTPQIYGDDPVLDQLWDSCEAGVGAACDSLWRLAPIGSSYERFGVTCGERFEVLDCTDLDLRDRDAGGLSDGPRNVNEPTVGLAS